MTLFANHARQMTQFSQFSTRLHALLKAHLGLKEALEILHEDESDKPFKQKIEQMKASLLQGTPFQTALLTLIPSSQKIPLQLQQSIPNIQAFLAEMAVNTISEWESYQKLKKELAYPAFLLTSCVALMFLFLLVLLPNYATFFKEGQTPWLMSLLLYLSDFLKTYGIALLFILILAVVLGGSKFQAPLLRFLKKQLMPPEEIALFWTLGLLLQSGYSIKETLASISLSPSQVCFQKFEKAKQLIQHTGEVASSFEETFVLSKYHAATLKNGEQTNTLAVAFLEISADLKKYHTEKRSRKLTLIQPLLLLIISGMIMGFLYLSFLPIIQGMKTL